MEYWSCTVVEVVGPGTLPPADFKAHRVIDDRTAFREMYEHIKVGKH